MYRESIKIHTYPQILKKVLNPPEIQLIHIPPRKNPKRKAKVEWPFTAQWCCRYCFINSPPQIFIEVSKERNIDFLLNQLNLFLCWLAETTRASRIEVLLHDYVTQTASTFPLHKQKSIFYLWILYIFFSLF